ncbi:histone chaperone asf1-like [Daphnia pulex]|uniref:histone chaperone asf1-like n=1 Tax=Daphnia pulex TaxID=6669 RepID=UPI001EDDDCD4|nr:histone chaperone asf1-like [Daphnia pulex]XP_046638681.1 histone chaperone asf1-like [Daphnia pulicaria]
MAKVHIVDVKVLNNPCPFFSPFQFEIVFECIDEIPEDLEWKLTYVGSAESAAHDQILDTVVVGPVPVGKHKFVFQADQPDPEKIPVADAIGVTAVLLTCSYKEHEFVRVGYFVNNDYIDPELKDNPPPVPQFDKMTRNILEEPRVTRFKIDWGGEVLEAANEVEMETQAEMQDNAESSLMEPPLKSYIHSESSHSTMEVV